MKIMLMIWGLFLTANAQAQYEVTKSTFAVDVLSISTSVVTLVSPALPIKSSGAKWDVFSVSIFNVNASTIAYTLHSSTYSVPGLTCANGAIIGASSDGNPVVLTEQFVDLYMWAIGCGTVANEVRRVYRGK